ncbi:asparagine synthase-related protein [Edaphobacter dinghuensis]|uniref:asparagine synthase (glutamine-hydrolyzing) n=1 Tax=Edaphobacter dinghuensis TaxID=1560005 RepID=A0A917HPC5_9BACT|nr:asparagine synthase-related protein [Edaphobacter dinghuensis]GGG86419.1 asparagine synthetase B [Edaphobacter dinghuensis]
MSTIFGILLKIDGMVAYEDLESMSAPTSRYAVDGTYLKFSGRVGMGFQPFYTHDRSTLESVPLENARGDLVAVDGRIDNYKDLQNALELNGSSSDSITILAAFAKWGSDCFSHFIGEWSIALWSATTQELYLVRDHAGTRPLYLCERAGKYKWATYLDAFRDDIADADIDMEYIQRYISGAPLLPHSPYRHIRQVGPGQVVCIKSDHLTTYMHWRCAESPIVRCQVEQEYVSVFLELLERAVVRRTEGYNAPILELSGGMDSSAITCMSDRYKRRSRSPLSLLDTISFYSDREPSWNEEPYFASVERQRGKSTCRITLPNYEGCFLSPAEAEDWMTAPGISKRSIAVELAIKPAIADRGYRAIVSGIGGDEVLGGNPDPIPEIADLWRAGAIAPLMRRSLEWALAKDTLIWRILFGGALFCYRARYDPSALLEITRPPWLRHHNEQQKDDMLRQLLDSCGSDDNPTLISNRAAWISLLETLPSCQPDHFTRYEYRYPYLDQELVNFAFSLPRDQLVRPGRRRYLMRKALVGIVPEMILERGQKGVVGRGPLAELISARMSDPPLFHLKMSAELGIVDRTLFTNIVNHVCSSQDPKWIHAIYRTMEIESWLHTRFSTKAPHFASTSLGMRADALHPQQVPMHIQ